MNQPNMPPGYGPPPQGHPQQGPVPHQPPPGGYPPPPPQGMRGMTRQMFNPASYRQTGSGSWAASSLIISIVSIFMCGLLAPLSLILGMVGMVGKKRAKGLAFTGFALSALQIAAWVILIAAGAWAIFQSESLANEAGAPVVAAVREFRDEHGRVPHNLNELVALGYLPTRWTEGLEGVSESVRETVEGKEWHEFLHYMPGRDANWTGDGWTQTLEGGRTALDDFFAEMSGEDREVRVHQTYGLVFIGVDSAFGSSTAVDQSLEFELMKLWGADPDTRQIAAKRRELQVMARQLDSRMEEYQAAKNRATAALERSERELRERIRENNLNTRDAIRADNIASSLLQLVGQERQTVAMAEAKIRNTGDTIRELGIQVRQLANEEERARLADSPGDYFARLTVLLEDSQKVLNTGGELGDLDRLNVDDFADEWIRENVR
jgi:hypothetical protein